jgi:hypothetical protein
MLPSTAGAAGIETDKSLRISTRGQAGHAHHRLMFDRFLARNLRGIMYRWRQMMPEMSAHLGNLSGPDLAATLRLQCQSRPLTHALASALTKANYERDLFNKRHGGFLSPTIALPRRK